MMIELNRVYNEDCLEGMKRIPDKSVDMILCDLPYGTTACKWDSIIPFEPLWEQYERVIKDNGAIVLFGSQPFTTDLINSNRKLFRYEWIWNKGSGVNFIHARKMPLKIHENILVFYKKLPVYNPQMTDVEPEKDRTNRTYKETDGNFNVFSVSGGIKKRSEGYNTKKRFPKSIQYFDRMAAECNTQKRVHPTQKPLTLFEYLILTYTNEFNEQGEKSIVLDNCMGSFTTAIACINTNRRYIGFELDEGYYNMGCKRVDDHMKQLHSNGDNNDV